MAHQGSRARIFGEQCHKTPMTYQGSFVTKPLWIKKGQMSEIRVHKLNWFTPQAFAQVSRSQTNWTTPTKPEIIRRKKAISNHEPVNTWSVVQQLGLPFSSNPEHAKKLYSC